MSVEQTPTSVVKDMSEHRRIVRAGVVGASYLLTTATLGGLTGYGIANSYEKDRNAAEKEESVAILRCAEFIVDKTIELGSPLIIKASDLTKQQRDDCGAPDPVERDDVAYGFFDGRIIEEDYVLQMPSASELEVAASEKNDDSQTRSAFNLVGSAGIGATGGLLVPLSMVGIAGSIRNNRRRNNGKFSYIDVARRSKNSIIQTVEVLVSNGRPIERPASAEDTSQN